MCVFRAAMNCPTLVQWHTVLGRSFHALGAAQEKACSPILVREVGCLRCSLSYGCSERVWQ